MDDEEDIQCPKPEGLNREQVAGPYLAPLLGQKLPPAGGGGSAEGDGAYTWRQYVHRPYSRDVPVLPGLCAVPKEDSHEPCDE